MVISVLVKEPPLSGNAPQQRAAGSVDTPAAVGVSAPRPPLSPVMPAVSTMNDEALGGLALRGRTDAWDALIQRHNHRVLVSLLARGVPLWRARELAQDTWARLIEQQRRGALGSLTLPGLAITQAAFLALEDARRDGARRPRALDLALVAETVADPGADAEERLLSREQLARAEDALSRCSGSAQRVFRLLYENPTLSHAEAAQQVGLSLQRVRQILCEVRKKLRAALMDQAE